MTRAKREGLPARQPEDDVLPGGPARAIELLAIPRKVARRTALKGSRQPGGEGEYDRGVRRAPTGCIEAGQGERVAAPKAARTGHDSPSRKRLPCWRPAATASQGQGPGKPFATAKKKPLTPKPDGPPKRPATKNGQSRRQKPAKLPASQDSRPPGQLRVRTSRPPRVDAGPRARRC